jgi:hypothetical protein
MSYNTRHDDYKKHESRLEDLINTYKKDTDLSTDMMSNISKYIAVLVSGYLEQAIKEIFIKYALAGARPQVSNYIQKSWPTSKNMHTRNIADILQQFDTTWEVAFLAWLEQDETRKKDINSIVQWRNSIAHGNETHTLGVTINSVYDAFKTIQSLVLFIEQTVDP